MVKRKARIQRAKVFSLSLIFLLVFVGLMSSSVLRNVNVGDEAPNFVLQDTSGSEFSLTNLRGKIVILVFWKAAQKRCIEVLTTLQSIYTQFKGQGVEVLALSNDKGGLELINKIKQEKQLTFPMLHDREGKAYGDYGIIVTPGTIIIDKEGLLSYYYPSYRGDFSLQISGRVEVLLGFRTLEELQAELQTAQNPKLSEAEKRAKRCLNAGNRLLKKGMTQSAMLQYQKAVQEEPELFEAHLCLGDIYLELKQPQEAATAFTQAIKLQARASEARAGLGDALFLQGQLQKSKEMLQTALKLNPHLARAHYRLGRIYEEQKQTEDALKEYKIALKILLKIKD